MGAGSQCLKGHSSPNSSSTNQTKQKLAKIAEKGLTGLRLALSQCQAEGNDNMTNFRQLMSALGPTITSNGRV